MLAAFTIWNGRIAPVFDVAGQALLVDSTVAGGPHSIMQLPPGTALDKLNFLQHHQVQVLVCGAMTRPTNHYANSINIEVFPFVSGDQQEVVDTWLSQRLLDNKFCMPGCGRNGCFRRNRGRQGGRGHNSRLDTPE